ncbi:glycoside hydrolase family 3 C-terminal domain-containing protein [Microbulbifer salipaludis]|uniref:beta-glucosidase n=2 Tax=Microbulbifer salipaludis TaxID=187980 RepID=A0ABS3E6R3_9GAMM|nr:glycoside hydrolase family 3 C-terminal domain-containing protein [Microbulbifer salipaludis]
MLVSISSHAESSLQDRVEGLLAEMTLAEKIGQMTQAERQHATPEDVKKYYLGSILNGGGSVPGKNRRQDWVDMISGYQQAAQSTRLGIPILYGTDAVHGHSNVKDATIFPHNVAIGATRNPRLAHDIGVATALETAATGVHWTFAPTLCVARDDRWGRAYECFGEQPDLVSEFSGPFVKGLQGGGLNGNTIGQNRVIATAKHWVADGGTTYGTGDEGYAIDRGDTRLEFADLERLHIAPYLPALKADVGTVMVSYSSVNGTKMHEHKGLVNDTLKGDLGFSGFTISDWSALSEIPAETNRERVVRSVNAGLDMVMEPENWKEFISDLTDAVKAGEVPMSRIDEAVRRILMIKLRSGLFEHPVAPIALRADADMIIGNAQHRALARQAVRESVVLLKNEGGVLPIDKESRIFVAGSHANDIGLQSGGWTIEWQGKSGVETTGTSILEGIQDLAHRKVSYSADGTGAAGHDVAVVVIGEDPYAEGWGDYRPAPCEKCKPIGIGEDQRTVLDNVRASGVPMVVVLVSGRPLMIEEEISSWNSMVAAWLPGSEGAGVADVLLGDYAPTGKLPVTWPKKLSQIPINYGDKEYEPLFPYGFGMTY